MFQTSLNNNQPRLLSLRTRVKPLEVNDLDDMNDVRSAMEELGEYGGRPASHYQGSEMELTLRESLRNFQKSKGLEVDGALLPGGETEREINKALLQKRNAEEKPFASAKEKPAAGTAKKKALSEVPPLSRTAFRDFRNNMEKFFIPVSSGGNEAPAEQDSFGNRSFFEEVKNIALDRLRGLRAARQKETALKSFSEQEAAQKKQESFSSSTETASAKRPLFSEAEGTAAERKAALRSFSEQEAARMKQESVSSSTETASAKRPLSSEAEGAAAERKASSPAMKTAVTERPAAPSAGENQEIKISENARRLAPSQRAFMPVSEKPAPSLSKRSVFEEEPRFMSTKAVNYSMNPRDLLKTRGKDYKSRIGDKLVSPLMSFEPGGTPDYVLDARDQLSEIIRHDPQMYQAMEEIILNSMSPEEKKIYMNGSKEVKEELKGLLSGVPNKRRTKKEKAMERRQIAKQEWAHVVGATQRSKDLNKDIEKLIQEAPEISDAINRRANYINFHAADKEMQDLGGEMLELLASPTHEGYIPHLYLDSVGKITSGIGKNMESNGKMEKEHFLELNLYHSDGRRVSLEEKKEYWNFIQKEKAELEEQIRKREAVIKQNEDNKMTGGAQLPVPKIQAKRASYFDRDIYLSDRKIFNDAANALLETTKSLKKKFPDYDEFPIAAKKAHIDMEYNMGGNFRRGKWPKFFEAVDKRDWETAAKQSKRGQLSHKRNTWVKNHLLAAHRAATEGKKEENKE